MPDGLPWTFVATVLAVELTPGPNMAYLAVTSAERGRRAAFAVVLGITLGLTTYLLATVLGLKEVLAQAPWIYDLLRWAGVLYLLYLAYDIWAVQESAPERPGLPLGGLRLVGRGVLVNLLNPKAAVFYIALLPTFVVPSGQNATMHMLALGAFHIGVSIVVHSLIVLGAGWSILHRRGSGARIEKWSRVVFAGVLVLVALWAAFEGGVAA